MVRAKIEAAFRRFLEKDSYLLTAKANERSITHRFAMYIEEQFPGFNVDCEYNRDGMESKRLETFKRPVDSADEKGVTVYPDIIVHHRGTANNLLVVEAKLSSNDSPCQSHATCTCDHCKLRAYKSDLGYVHAFYVVFPVDDKLEGLDEAHLYDFITEIQ